MAITPGSGPKAAHYTDIGPSYHGAAVKLAAADMFRSGNSRILWIGDSFASKVNSLTPAFAGRVAQSFARRANFAGKITAYTTTPRDNGAGTLNQDDVSVYEFGGSSTAGHATAGVVRVEPNDANATWTAYGSTQSTTVADYTAAPIWGAFTISHVLGASTETLTAIHNNQGNAFDSYELFRVTHKTTDGNGKFVAEFETPDGSTIYMGARLCASVPPVPFDNTNPGWFRGAGEVAATAQLDVSGTSTGTGIMNWGGPYWLAAPETAGFVQAATRASNGVGGTARRYQRMLLSGNVINGADAIVVNNNIDGLDANGDPNLVLRLGEAAYDTPGADAGRWMGVGPITFYTCDTDGTPRPGIYIDHQFGIGSSSYANVYTDAGGTPPGTNITTTSATTRKNVGASVLRDYIVAHTLDLRPLTVFIDFADENLNQTNMNAAVDSLLSEIKDALMDGGSRVSGLEDLELRIIFVHSFMCTTGGYAADTIAAQREAGWEGIKEAVDDFNAAGHTNATAGAISLYGAVNGILFGDPAGDASGASHTWTGSTTLAAEAEAWIKAQGLDDTVALRLASAQATKYDQLDAVDQHTMVDGANFMAEVVEGAMRASLGGGGFRSRGRGGRGR